MKEKNQVVPDEVLSKEFLSQFKTEADVSKFLKQLWRQIIFHGRFGSASTADSDLSIWNMAFTGSTVLC